MSESEMDNAQFATEWTTAELLKLVGRIRLNTPESEKTTNYKSGLLFVNWDKTAFRPYSPKECHDKWHKVMEKMRKCRSLSELIAEAEEVVSKPLLHRKIHPDFPKHACPPRADYITNNFSRLKRMHPKLALPAIVVLGHKKYDELPDKKKDKYKKKYALGCEEYRRKFDKFCKDNNIQYTKKRRKAKVSAIADADLPVKPPLNSLGLFMKEKAAENSSSFGLDFFKDMRKHWKSLKAAEKQKYSTKCRKMKQEYNAKLKEYLDRFDETEKQRIMKEQDISFMRTKPLASRSEPKMPSQTPWSYFAKDKMMSSAKSEKLWRLLPAKEKERYKEQMQSDMKQYTENLQKWFKNLTSRQQTKYMKQNPRKLQFLDAKKKQVDEREELHLRQPSDSEDEDIMDVSSEDDIWSSYEDESEEDMFEMHR